MKRKEDADGIEVCRVRARRKDDRPRIGATRWESAFNRAFETSFGGENVNRRFNVPRSALDNAEEQEPVRTRSTGPAGPVWPIQSGAAQSPMVGREARYPSREDRHISRVTTPFSVDRTDGEYHRAGVALSVPTGTSSVPSTLAVPGYGRVRATAMTYIPADSDLPTRIPPVKAALHEAERPDTGCTAMVVRVSGPHPSVSAIDTALHIRAQAIVRQREALAMEAAEERALFESRNTAPLRIPTPKRLPRPARKGAPVPAGGIETAHSTSGRCLDPKRRR